MSPLLRGLFGLAADAGAHRLTLTPHVPADWTWFKLDQVRVGPASLRIAYRKTVAEIILNVTRTGSGDCTLDFSPALSLRAQVAGVEMNGRRIPFQIKPSDLDQHVSVRFPVTEGANELRIHLRNDFGLSVSPALPPLGSSSQGLRVISQAWTPSRDSLTLELAGVPGKQYEMAVWDPAQITSVAGAELVKTESGNASLKIQFRGSASDTYGREKVTIHFSGKSR
jgi:hypothetical protein